MALQIRDCDRLKEYLIGNGGQIVHEPQMGHDRVMFIHDCNGVLIELICPPEQDSFLRLRCHLVFHGTFGYNKRRLKRRKTNSGEHYAAESG